MERWSGCNVFLPGLPEVSKHTHTWCAPQSRQPWWPSCKSHTVSYAQLPLVVRLLLSQKTAERSHIKNIFSEFTVISYYYLSHFFCSCAISSTSISSSTVTTPSRSWAIILVAWLASLQWRQTALWENTSLINTLCKGPSSTVTQAPYIRRYKKSRWEQLLSVCVLLR